MKRIAVCAAALAAAAGGCNAGSGNDPASLVGKWEGNINCYNADMMLGMVIDAATPTKAAMVRGDLATVTWDATVTLDKSTVTIKSDGPADGADVLAGPLSADGKAISGTMDKQLCRSFKLTRTG